MAAVCLVEPADGKASSLRSDSRITFSSRSGVFSLSTRFSMSSRGGVIDFLRRTSSPLLELGELNISRRLFIESLFGEQGTDESGEAESDAASSSICDSYMHIESASINLSSRFLSSMASSIILVAINSWL
ncbi:hypothetical protein BpHYR1_039341 [Brachionus plicatilis]|uniref:Uncharacterized protein n=1 Tax=Brachionus plicatilis TaxID=10195 RepID=A0A3M7SUR9_BRAPC|nr:hypothetical protein BpHYR1_039341 [Brachionus plicatilis]